MGLVFKVFICLRKSAHHCKVEKIWDWNLRFVTFCAFKVALCSFKASKLDLHRAQVNAMSERFQSLSHTELLLFSRLFTRGNMTRLIQSPVNPFPKARSRILLVVADFLFLFKNGGRTRTFDPPQSHMPVAFRNREKNAPHPSHYCHIFCIEIIVLGIL